MSEVKISKGLHGQLERVAKVGACNLNAPLKQELSALNEHLFGFKLNTFCQTCVLDAMHKVNDHIANEKEAVVSECNIINHDDIPNAPFFDKKEIDEKEKKTVFHKSVEVYSKSFLKKLTLSELQELGKKIDNNGHEPKIGHIDSKGQGIKSIAGIKKLSK